MVVLAAVMTALGALSPSPPPGIHLVAYVSLVMIGAVIAVGAWVDSSPPPGSRTVGG
jgi:hypothetical protein